MAGRRLPLLLFGLSFCLLAFEIGLLRILSLLQWYHFAYLIISLALLGFAVSGTLMHLFRDFWLKHAESAAAVAILATALAMALGRQALAFIPMDTFLAIWRPAELLWLCLLCLLLFLPFLFGAFFLILAFTAASGRIGVCYGANLLGSGAGSLGALALLQWWHPLAIPFVLALATAALGIVWLPRHRLLLPAALVTLALIAVCWLHPSSPAISQYKPLYRAKLMPETQLLSEGFGPLGVVDIVQSPHLRSAPGLSLSFDGDIPARPIAYLDGEEVGPLPEGGDRTMHGSLFNTPYRLRPVGRVLVLNAGTGTGASRALAEGALSVTAVERNRVLLDIVTGSLPDYRSVYAAAEVHVVADDPRSFLMRDDGSYELIVLPPAEGLAGASLGMQSLYENYLLTTESFAAMLARLDQRGMIVTNCWIDTPPRRPLKLLALMAETLRRQGVADPGAHLLALRNWNMVTLLMSRAPFTVGERSAATAFAQAQGFTMLLPAGDAAETAGDEVTGVLADELAGLASTPLRYSASLFRLEPPTDESPYFGHFLSLEGAAYLWRSYGAAGLVLQEWGYVLAGATLIMLAAAGLLLVVLPLWLWQRRQDQAGKGGLGYFAAIGAGFMFLEMLFIQKLVLVLGEPVYAVATVTAAVLIFAGAGSMLSGRLVAAMPPGRSTALLLALLLLDHLLLPLLLPSIAALAAVWRFAAAMLLLAPACLLMGVFFPAGIRMLEGSGRASLIPWAWAINGFVSVMAAPTALLIALNSGFAVLGAVGITCYAAAVLIYGREDCRFDTG